MTIMVIVFLAAFGLTAGVGLLLSERDMVRARFGSVVGQQNRSSAAFLRNLIPRQRTPVETIVKPFQNLLPRSTSEVSIVQRRLIRAGLRDPSAVNIFYGAKVLVPSTLVLAAFLTGAYHAGPFFVFGVAGGLGFMLPDFWLGNRVTSRQFKLRLGLPEALDLMVICTEAGLGLDQTLNRVAEELRNSQPELRDELQLINLEQKAGRPREDALKNFAERANIDSVRNLVTTLVQADTFGTSISKTLRVYSDTLRTQRRQQAEEMAAKTTVKLVFPLVLFIFPSIFVVTLGPSIITIIEGMANYFG